MQTGISRNKYKKTNITSHYRIFTIEIIPQPNQNPHQVQTDVIDKEFSKVFTE